MFWPTLVSKFGEGSFTIGSIIQTTISHFSTDFDYKGKNEKNIFANPSFIHFVSNILNQTWYILIPAVQRFFRGKRKDVGSGLRNLDQAIEQILINKEWKEANEKTIKDWIDNKILETQNKIIDTNPLIYQV